MYSTSFFCSVNFRLSIYLSFRIVGGIIGNLVKRRLSNENYFFLNFAFSEELRRFEDLCLTSVVLFNFLKIIFA